MKTCNTSHEGLLPAILGPLLGGGVLVLRAVPTYPDTIVYETAGHAFVRDGTEHHVPEAADDAWSRLLSHFDKHLRASEHMGRSGNHRAM